MPGKKPPFNLLLVIVLVALGGGAGYLAGLQFGDEGLEDVYAENWAYVGAGVGFIIALLVGRMRTRA